MYVYVCMCVRVCVYVYTPICVHACAYIYIYTYGGPQKPLTKALTNGSGPSPGVYAVYIYIYIYSSNLAF